MTVEMHMIVKEILGYSKRGIMQKLFIEAKIIKLLILIFEQFNEKNILEDTPKTPEMIRKFIDENYHRNIKSRRDWKIYRNESKCHQERIQSPISYNDCSLYFGAQNVESRKLITNKEIMIKEIAIECGYEYLQNFTRAFKKEIWGIS